MGVSKKCDKIDPIIPGTFFERFLLECSELFQTETMDSEPMQYSLMDTPGLALNGPDVFEINSTGAVIKKSSFDYQQANGFQITLVVVAKTSNAFASSCVYYVKVRRSSCPFLATVW